MSTTWLLNSRLKILTISKNFDLCEKVDLSNGAYYEE